MAQVLYRKYRPQKFKDVIGQDHVIRTLLHALKTGDVAHAYLFAGPRGVGKTTVARILARAVNCEKKGSSEPCGTCASCKRFEGGRSLELVEIDAASNRGIDEIRELREKVRMAPAEGLKRVYIIDEVHMLTTPAFNALLKTLEEPPAHALFVLATTETHKLPATIISRCQRFDFKRLAKEDLIKNLDRVVTGEKMPVEKGVLELVAEEAGGSSRDAISILGQIAAYAKGEITLAEAREALGISGREQAWKFTELLAKKEAKSALEMVRDLADRGYHIEHFIGVVLSILRLVLIQSYGVPPARDLNDDEKKSLDTLAAKLPIERLTKIIERLQVAVNEQKGALPVTLPLELAIVDLCDITTDRAQIGPSEAPSAMAAESLEKSPPPAAKEVKESSLDLSLVREKWKTVVARLTEKNFSLGLLLKIACVTACQGKKVILGLPYKFHLEQLALRKNRKIIEETVTEVTEIECEVEGQLVAAPPVNSETKMSRNEVETEHQKDGEMINAALKILGGKLVE